MFGDFSCFFCVCLYAFELSPRSRNHQCTCLCWSGKDDSQVVLSGWQKHRRISWSATTPNTLCDFCPNDIARSEAQVHFNLIALEISDVFLLDDSNKDWPNWMVSDCQNIYLAKPILNLCDPTIYFLPVQWLSAQISFLHFPDFIFITLNVFLDYNFIQVILVIPTPLWQNTNRSWYIAVDLPHVNISAISCNHPVSVGHQQFAWVSLWVFCRLINLHLLN